MNPSEINTCSLSFAEISGTYCDKSMLVSLHIRYIAQFPANSVNADDTVIRLFKTGIILDSLPFTAITYLL